ncbi:hypothetical protein CVT25_004844 [Psilocybe cyanescens]|uniref:Uncharacterized protein n=1 Tax=Psilocybe cyanescens TaxID=93625 RepID=A0A409XML3_PSICY|nr:hypothetical protein CVT25_004844 [Psilocybe cyanescens]
MEGDTSDSEDEQEDEVGRYLNGFTNLKHGTRAPQPPSSAPSAPSKNTSCTPSTRHVPPLKSPSTHSTVPLYAAYPDADAVFVICAGA